VQRTRSNASVIDTKKRAVQIKQINVFVNDAKVNQATGLVLRRPKPVRYERARPGELVHMDVKISIESVMTDHGPAYRSRDFAAHLKAADITHLWIRPYRPQTNGKVERFNRTLVTEWAYATLYLTDEARAATYDQWLHFYNHHRPHTGIGGEVPADRVHNLTVGLQLAEREVGTCQC
jgi:transposase InsO family protein